MVTGGFQFQLLLIMLVGVLMLSSACTVAPPMSTSKVPSSTKGQTHYVYWTGDRGDTYSRYMQAGEWANALSLVRQEIATPANQAPEHLAAIRIFGLDVLKEFVERSFQEKIETVASEANVYFQTGLNHAQAAGSRSLTGQLYGRYASILGALGKPGQSLIYLKKELNIWRELEDTYNEIVTYQSLAEYYLANGDQRLRDYFRHKAVVLGNTFFQLPKQFSSHSDELNAQMGKIWMHILHSRIDDLIMSKRQDGQMKIIPTIDALWAVLERVNFLYGNPNYVIYLSMAKVYALLGDMRKTWDLYSKAQDIANREKALVGHSAVQTEMSLLCERSLIFLESGDYQHAHEQFKKCEERLNLYKDYIKAKIYIKREAGKIYELAEDFKTARDYYLQYIDAAERARSSYSIVDRQRFFTSPVFRPAYWGLIRATAHIAIDAGSREEFYAALAATERIRARQLGDLLDPQETKPVSQLALQDLQRTLSPETVLLDYILTDTHVVLLALTRDAQQAVVLPYDASVFANQCRELAALLSQPTSDLTAIDQAYARFSRQLLDPVADLVQDKYHVLVLPDGALSLIPFDLMPVPGMDGVPLIFRAQVQVVPSLRTLQHLQQQTEQAQAGLLAVGDPVYAASPTIPGVTEEELQAVTRGHAYLHYFTPLPETRSEVETIAELIQPAKPLEVFLGPAATESTLKTTNLTPFRYVHIATHGILGGEVPGIMEPALVFGEEAQEDGFLTASEVEAMKLQAKLTVLSACKTGTGEYVTGEGVLGMSRAFLVAGSQAAVVSLWNVASKETETLMMKFYRYLRQGVEVATALRRAKLDLMGVKLKSEADVERGIDVVGLAELNQVGKPSAHTHPYFWAPFIYVGI